MDVYFIKVSLAKGSLYLVVFGVKTLKIPVINLLFHNRQAKKYKKNNSNPLFS